MVIAPFCLPDDEARSFWSRGYHDGLSRRDTPRIKDPVNHAAYCEGYGAAVWHRDASIDERCERTAGLEEHV